MEQFARCAGSRADVSNESIPMIMSMIVAILTVKLKKVSGLDDFVELDEPLYALSFVWLFFSGAGWLSLDFLLRQFVRRAVGHDK